MSAEHPYAKKMWRQELRRKRHLFCAVGIRVPRASSICTGCRGRIRQFRADSVMDLSLQAFQLDLRIAALLETLEQCYPELELKKTAKTY